MEAMRVGATLLAAGIPAMPGMGGGPGPTPGNPRVVSAFHTTLLFQGLIVLVIAGLVLLAWSFIRRMQLERPKATQPVPVLPPEPVARRLLRICFGLLWILDGILQGQPGMPMGMVPKVIRPALAGSPAWVHDLVNDATAIWIRHPPSAAAGAVWIQVGIGVWLLAAPRGSWSRLGGLVSVGWGLVVWVFGEAFGGIFGPGYSVLFGAPGAALLYCVAGVLIALPERLWLTSRLGRRVGQVTGLFLVGMAVLQAWPNRGFWLGQGPHADNSRTLVAMVTQMAKTPQPHWLSSWVAGFGAFDAAHAWGVNLFVVIVLAGVGLGLLTARRTLVAVAVTAGVLGCLVDWVLIEDLGFFGGVGTDPNSMIPLAVVLVAGYVAMSRVPAAATFSAGSGSGVPGSGVPGRPGWRDRVVLSPSYAFRSVAAIGALGVILVGAAPLAVAAINPNASPILTRAHVGAAGVTGAAVSAGATGAAGAAGATGAAGILGGRADLEREEATQCWV